MQAYIEAKRAIEVANSALYTAGGIRVNRAASQQLLFIGSLMEYGLDRHISLISILVFSPVVMASQTPGDIIRDTFLIMFLGHLRFIMAGEASKTARTGRMAPGTYSTCTPMVGRKGVVKAGAGPAISAVAIRTLAAEMISWAGMASLAIRSTGSLMVESSREPAAGGMAGRALSAPVIGRLAVNVTGLAVNCAGDLVIETGRFPCVRGMAG